MAEKCKENLISEAKKIISNNIEKRKNSGGSQSCPLLHKEIFLFRGSHVDALFACDLHDNVLANFHR